MVGDKDGVVFKWRKFRLFCQSKFNCILHQKTERNTSLKIDLVLRVVIQTVNFIRAKGLDHLQFEVLLSEHNILHSIPWGVNNEVRWLSWVALVKCFLDLCTEIVPFVASGREGGAKPASRIFWVTGHSNVLNVNMQSTEYHHSIHAFQMKPALWRTQSA